MNQIITFNGIFFIKSVKQLRKNLELAVIEERIVNEIVLKKLLEKIHHFSIKYYFRSSSKKIPFFFPCSRFYTVYIHSPWTQPDMKSGFWFGGCWWGLLLFGFVCWFVLSNSNLYIFLFCGSVSFLSDEPASEEMG